MEMEAICSSETSVDNGLQGVISQKMVIFGIDYRLQLQHFVTVYTRPVQHGALIYSAGFNVNQNFKKNIFLNNSMFQFFS
jgi:hypothetical protein